MSSILDTLVSCVQGDIREETYFLLSETWLSSLGGRGAAVKGKCIERRAKDPLNRALGSILVGVEERHRAEGRRAMADAGNRDGPGNQCVAFQKQLCNCADLH